MKTVHGLEVYGKEGEQDLDNLLSDAKFKAQSRESKLDLISNTSDYSEIELANYKSTCDQLDKIFEYYEDVRDFVNNINNKKN